MRKITVGRTEYLQIGSKSLVELPPKTVETCFVDLSTEEREQYDLMESNARMLLDGFIRNNSAMRNYSTFFRIIFRLCQICNCVELCPSDMRLPCPSSSLGDISKNPKLQAKLSYKVEMMLSAQFASLHQLRLSSHLVLTFLL